MTSSNASEGGWTKVLLGRYLLGGGAGSSRRRFFKLLPGSDAQSVIASARSFEQKLGHIKITSTVNSKSTAPIVTEKLGGSDAQPKSLEDFFQQGTPEQASDIARQIGKQVGELGNLLPDHKPTKSVFWEALSRENLVEQWNRFSGKGLQVQVGMSVDPISLYAECMSSERKLHVKERSVVHGDLHIHNVAVDVDGGKAETFIFDPGVVTQNIAGRDLAALEVSVLLHEDVRVETLSEICSVLYPQSGASPKA